MAGFLYLLESQSPITDLAPWGLDHLGRTAKSLATRPVTTPMGSGQLVTADEGGRLIAFHADEQEWHRIPEAFSPQPAWLGWWKDAKPTAEDLAKPQQLEGDKIKLLDGHTWVVPRLRDYKDDDPSSLAFNNCLPTLLKYNESGKLQFGDVLPQYREIFQRSLEVADFVFFGGEDGDGRNPTEQELVEFACDVLSINYKISRFEIIQSGLLSHELASEVWRLALDLRGFKERVKNLQSRSLSTGVNSEHGGEPSNTVEPVNTDQP